MSVSHPRYQLYFWVFGQFLCGPRKINILNGDGKPSVDSKLKSSNWDFQRAVRFQSNIYLKGTSSIFTLPSLLGNSSIFYNNCVQMFFFHTNEWSDLSLKLSNCIFISKLAILISWWDRCSCHSLSIVAKLRLLKIWANTFRKVGWAPNREKIFAQTNLRKFYFTNTLRLVCLQFELKGKVMHTLIQASLSLFAS